MTGCSFSKHVDIRARMAQRINVFVTKPDGLSSVTGIHMTEGKNFKLSSDFHSSATAITQDK